MKKILMMAAVCLMAVMTFAAQCAATTKKGTQCKRQASPGSEFCWQHGGTTKAERAANGESATPRRAARRATWGDDGDNGAPARRARRGNGGESDVTAANDAPAAIEGRCQATTKRGTQCMRKARAGEKYCAQHSSMMGGGKSETFEETPARSRRTRSKAESNTPAEPAAAADGMCQGTTKDGSPCKRKAKAGSKFCWQHDK